MPRIAVEQIDVSYADRGVGTPVVLVHCTAGSSRAWTDVADMLPAPVRVLVPDLFGHGETRGRPPMRASALEQDAGIVRALADRLDRPVHVIGHSYGGAVALEAALRWPERIAGLTLVEPARFTLLRFGGAADAAHFDGIAGLAIEIAEAAVRGEPERAMARFVDYWSGPETFARLREETRARLARHALDTVLHFHATISEATDPQALAACRVPAAILRGAASPAPTRRIAAMLAELMPAAVLETVPGAGHMLPQTHPGVVAEAAARQVHAPARLGRAA